MEKKTIGTILAIGTGVILADVAMRMFLKNREKNKNNKDDTKNDFDDIFANASFESGIQAKPMVDYNAMKCDWSLSGDKCQCGFYMCPYTIQDFSKLPPMDSRYFKNCHRGFKTCPFEDNVPAMSIPMFSSDAGFHNSLRDVLNEGDGEESEEDAIESLLKNNAISVFPSKFATEAEFREYCNCSSNGAIEYIIGVSDKYTLDELKNYSLTDLGKLYLMLYIENEKEVQPKSHWTLSQLLYVLNTYF